MVNARIIDNITGDVVASARTIIHIDDCDIYENCKSSKPIILPVVQKRTIGISDAGCSKVTCPENCVTEKCYNNTKQTKPTKEQICESCR